MSSITTAVCRLVEVRDVVEQHDQYRESSHAVESGHMRANGLLTRYVHPDTSVGRGLPPGRRPGDVAIAGRCFRALLPRRPSASDRAAASEWAKVSSPAALLSIMAIADCRRFRRGRAVLAAALDVRHPPEPYRCTNQRGRR